MHIERQAAQHRRVVTLFAFALCAFFFLVAVYRRLLSPTCLVSRPSGGSVQLFLLSRPQHVNIYGVYIPAPGHIRPGEAMDEAKNALPGFHAAR